MTMHYLIVTVLASLFATATSTISVLLPLYTYPFPATTNPSKSATWQPVYDAVNTYKSITFYIVVDPNSGPGCSKCTAPVDSNYVKAIGTLNNYTNVLTLGYVSTNYTNRAYSSVIADVKTYASWTKVGYSNVAMDGIFFDEMDKSGTAASLKYYQNASAYAYAQVPSDVTPVVFNPGSPTPAKYFDYADFIVECEDYYTNYTYPKTINTFTSGYNDQAAILLHNTTSNANLTTLVKNMSTSGIGAVYVCPDGFYNDLSLLGSLAAAIKKVG